ncbi:MAG: hypothetical protein GXP13_00585, partial [Gammaproteobacteria bacterium]|nr:hypothetical protein [Gammaproteobacteria bacterium]
KVDDVSYFSDGRGIIPGDLIRVGSLPAVRIKNVSYSKNEITLENSIKWVKNAGVNLNYSGSRPDMGLVDDNSSVGTDEILLPPDNIRLYRRLITVDN